VRVETKEEKVGSIIIPEQHGEACERAKVLCVGENAFMGYGDSHPWCEAGDIIHFVRYAGKEVVFLGDTSKYRVINDEDVYWVCDKEAGVTRG
jgi:co-chaperonin GroES (HSP10)